jgi:hypothetical protein
MVLSDQERRVVLALGQCLFPRDALLGVDADDARVVAWVDDYLARMDPVARTRIRALIRAFDLGFVAWAGRPTASFVTARPDDRAAYVASWDHSPTYTQRMLAEALRTVLTFAYVDSAVVDSALRPAGASRSSNPPERRESSGEKDKASA